MDGALHSAHGFGWWHLGIAAALAVALVLFTHRWMIAPIPWHRRLCLVSLRIAWSVLLLWCLWEPIIQSEVKHEKVLPPKVVVIVDASASMGMRSPSGADAWAAVSDSVQSLRKELAGMKVDDATWLAAGSSLRAWRDGQKPTDAESQLIRQLRDAINQEASPGSGLVVFLISDGQDTGDAGPGEVVAAARGKNVRIVPIVPEGLGPPAALARVDRISAPGAVAVNQSFQIKADVRLRRAGASSLNVVLEREGKELDRRTLLNPTDGTTQVSFAQSAEQRGSLLYTVRLLDGQTELSRLSSVVLARSQQNVRVLYVQGSMDWEYRFVRSAVSENPSIALEAISRIHDTAFLRQTGSEDPKLRSGRAIDDLRGAAANYDVVILANVNPELLGAELQQSLLDLVNKRGGGLLFFNGNAAQASKFHGTLLEELLPVTLVEGTSPPVVQDQRTRVYLAGFDDAGAGPSEKTFSDAALANQPNGPLANLRAMRLTPAGQASEIWRDASKREQVPLGDPPATFLFSAKARSAKPAALVLGIDPNEKTSAGQPLPLFVVQNIGAGRSAFLGVDALWRWRMQTPAVSRDYDRFWQQLLLWLGGRATTGGGSLESDHARYVPGQTVKLKVRLDRAEPKLGVFVRDAKGAEQPLAFGWTNATEGVAEYKATGPGELLFSARTADGPIAQQVVDVRGDELEQEYCGLNEPLLQQLARITQGQCLSSSEIGLAKSIIKPQVQTVTQRDLRALWHEPWILGLILALYGGELLLRRRYLLT